MTKPVSPTDPTYRICLSVPAPTLVAIDKAAREAGKNRSEFCRDNILAAAEAMSARVNKLDRILAALDANEKTPA